MIYKSINKRICEEVISCQKKLEFDPRDPRSLVILNDLLCILMPSVFLELRIKLNLGFYFHSPFPNLNYLKRLHGYKEIVQGLLACDVIFFNVHQQATNFLQVI